MASRGSRRFQTLFQNQHINLNGECPIFRWQENRKNFANEKLIIKIREKNSLIARLRKGFCERFIK
jgi:hypothetical protein